MACTCVVGLQWGDEAKGKIVDLLSDDHHMVVRYNGGANAGHTVVKGGITYKLSLLPTGILSPHMRAVIGNGVVVNPVRFFEEVNQLRSKGIAIGDNLVLSDHAHLIFPYHIEEERLCEQGASQAIGTTGRGIGPCYQDKVSRFNGIRVGELLHPDHLRERLRAIVARKNHLLHGLSADARLFDADALCDEYLGYAQQMRPHIQDTAFLLHRALKNNQRLLFEAAQGSLLDVDFGTYPYVTSSNSSTTGIWSGSGVPARNLTRIIGIIKAYTSRVGRGPFPTELDDGPTGLGEKIRKAGNEYGIRHRHRPAAPLWLARSGLHPLHCHAWGSRRGDGDAARRPQRPRRAEGLRRLRARRPADHRFPRGLIFARALQADLRDHAGMEVRHLLGSHAAGAPRGGKALC
jgi:adenylosuccinate synthase